MENVYFGHFEDREDVVTAFSGTDYYAGDRSIPEETVRRDLRDAEIIFAAYGTPCYEGYALVLYVKDGEVFEVHGAHCSCFGLEGQWAPELASIKELKQRELPGYYEFGKDAVEAFEAIQATL